MESHPDTHVLEVCHVPPSMSYGELFLPLTFFDLNWLKFGPVERLYYYELHDVSTNSFLDHIFPMLKEALSLTLSHFLALAGNLTWPSESPKPILQYIPGDSVSITAAESKNDILFDILTGDDVFEAINCRPLVPQLSASVKKASAISLQVTAFPNKGLSIGISSHHAVLDGKSSTMFMKAWAHIHKLLIQGKKDSLSLPAELTPFFDRDVIKDPSGIDVVYTNHWIEASKFVEPNSDPRSLTVWDDMEFPPSLVRATFKLTKADLSSLRNKVVSWKQKLSKENFHLSTFVITSAYVLTCMLKAIGSETQKKAYFIFAADFRARLDPPVPRNYIGNCVGKGGLLALENEYSSEEEGMANLAEKISKAIKETGNKLMDGAEEWVSEVSTIAINQGNILIGVAGSPRFEVYKTDYGWGMPKKVELVSVDRNGSIAMAESRDQSGGVELGIVLNKPEFEVFASEFHKSLKTSF